MAYAESVRYTFILALAAACFALPFSCAMEQLNIKRIAEARLRQKEENELDTHLKASPYEVTDNEHGAGSTGSSRA